MKKGSFVAVVLIAAICLLHFTPEAGGATRAPTANEPNTYTITIQNFMFSPQKLEVPANAKVTWINKDEESGTPSSRCKTYSLRTPSTRTKRSPTDSPRRAPTPSSARCTLE